MAGILGRVRGRHIPTSMPFRPARSMQEAIRAQDALDAAVASGDQTLARVIAASIRASDIPANEVGVMRSLRALERGPMEVLPARSFEDMGQEIGQSVRSYEGLRSGRTANLRNQPHAGSAGMELRAAAEDAIAGRQQAAASENLGRAAALLGAGGLAGMIADTADRMQPSPPGIQDFASEAMDDPMMDLPGDPSPMPLSEEPSIGDIAFDDPMATSDLAAESRPIPDSTPMALIREAIAAERAAPPSRPGRLSPEEIAALRSQVVDIRDAETGAPMDSFYPPESEEYKAEQRMKLMYPQLRRR
jgi:hypothetical protein